MRLGRVKELYSDLAYTEYRDIHREYFEWLCGLVKADDVDNSYMILMHYLHGRVFYSLVPNDENREKDGKKLRSIFVEQCPRGEVSQLDAPCSVLEMMIGLSFRCADIVFTNELSKTDTQLRYFWKMIENLDFDKFKDDAVGDYPFLGDYINNALDILLERKYRKDGRGGLFPLKKCKEDQRKVEIWYQMSKYILENGEVILK